MELDGRFEKLRTEETNLANLIADMTKSSYSHQRCDVIMVNSGAVRSNMVIPAGDLTYKDIAGMLPMSDSVILMEMSGAILRKALENAVSKYPSHEGRFQCVSGLRFVWDSRLEPYRRVVSVKLVKKGGEEEDLDDQKNYVVGVRGFMSAGGDGFECFTDPSVKMISDPQNAQDLKNIIFTAFDHLRH